MKKTFHSYLRETRGVAAIEFVFILPFLCLLYFGLVDVTALVSLNRKVTYTAGVIADLVAQSNTYVMKTDIDDYYNAAAMILDPIPATSVRVEVFGFRNNAGVISQIWSTNNGGPGSCGAAPSTATMGPLMVAGNDLIVARSCTGFVPYVTEFLGTTILGQSSFLVTSSNYQRPRSGLQMPCYQTTKGGALCT
jgi:Flp pilus assembly protein TadG